MLPSARTQRWVQLAGIGGSPERGEQHGRCKEAVQTLPQGQGSARGAVLGTAPLRARAAIPRLGNQTAQAGSCPACSHTAPTSFLGLKKEGVGGQLRSLAPGLLLIAADVRRGLLSPSSGLAKGNAAKNGLLCLEVRAPKHPQVTGALLVAPTALLGDGGLHARLRSSLCLI